VEAVSLVLPDDHPLIQLGFRGRIRLKMGVEVRVTGVSRRPRFRRRLPPLKRRAMVLMAFGFGPVELAGRLGLCLERAEALHEELTRNLGLDRIARQVRSAIQAGLIDPIGRLQEEDSRTEAIADPRLETQGEPMSDEDLVRIFFPDALATDREDGGWQVIIDPEARAQRLGEGMTERDAWSQAALRLWKDEWFRPIIVQLRTMRSEQPGQA
jgi:hypothetical protein